MLAFVAVLQVLISILLIVLVLMHSGRDTGFGGLANTKSEWALQPDDVAEVIADLIAHPARSLPSRVEIRPSQPQRKS